MKARPAVRRDRDRIVQAREVGRQQSLGVSAVVHARYDTLRHGVELEFRSGATMTIPRQMIAALDGASVRDLVSIAVSPAGDAISWRPLDVDVYVPGLVEHAFGRRLFEAIVVPGPPEAVAPVVAQAEKSGPAGPNVLSEREAAEYIGMSTGWLKKARTARFRGIIDAPPFVRAGATRIVYRRQDLDGWLARHVDNLERRES